jgi:hypothetical protein
LGALSPPLFFAVHFANPFERSADRQMSYIILETYKGTLLFLAFLAPTLLYFTFTVANTMKLNGSTSLALVIMMLVTTKPNLVLGTELVCLLGGDLACEVNCLTQTGYFDAGCSDDNECLCGHPDSPQQP